MDLQKESRLGQAQDIYNLPPKVFGPYDENGIECEDVSKKFNLLGKMRRFTLLRILIEINTMNFILLKEENLSQQEVPLVVEKLHSQIKQEQQTRLLVAQQVTYKQYNRIIRKGSNKLSKRYIFE